MELVCLRIKILILQSKKRKSEDTKSRENFIKELHSYRMKQKKKK